MMAKRTRYIPLKLEPVPPNTVEVSSLNNQSNYTLETQAKRDVSSTSNAHRTFFRLPWNKYPDRVYSWKVYYLPEAVSIPQSSIVYEQKRQQGFFKHPVLVVSVDKTYADFYALTSVPPVAIRELKMCLRLGEVEQDEGMEVLKLSAGSDLMSYETWVNLEQRFKIELAYLAEWSRHVWIDIGEKIKLDTRVTHLEQQQNRFIYKPLPQDFSSIAPGVILMLPNSKGAATLGAPVLVVENDYPRFRFCRVKSMEDSPLFRTPLSERGRIARQFCLEIAREVRAGHEGTPVMLLEQDSPDMRERSYVEVGKKLRWHRLDICKTWCWPPIRIQEHSLRLLKDYMDRAAAADTRPAVPEQRYTPYVPSPPVWGGHNATLYQGQLPWYTNTYLTPGPYGHPTYGYGSNMPYSYYQPWH